MQRVGLNPFSASTFALLLTMLYFVGDANTDVKCEQALIDIICLTSLTRAKPKDKMEFPA